LLREAGLLERRREFQQDGEAQRAFLQGLGVERESGARLISLFAYENDGLASWFDALATDARPSHVLVPESRILADVERWVGIDGLKAGAVHRRGALTVQVLPFVRQDEYDQLLWCCDFNAVRGEDSFVRAQWAGRPLLWHIYQQEEDVHLEKLEAFLRLYTEGLPEAAEKAISGLWRAWNAGQGVAEHWSVACEQHQVLAEHAQAWCQKQASRADLATALVKFYRNWI
jgi:uncharacterized repeat protein (TIGR03837 family)